MVRIEESSPIGRMITIILTRQIGFNKRFKPDKLDLASKNWT
jgi:hypothetical protein